ncbi:MAG: T9SS type B sorting domain-containing protein [Chitinophagaceae bacterium]|nr:MAG: T9SS type B sorting domain-containing protein [Chitinophagaceae bacterium]
MKKKLLFLLLVFAFLPGYSQVFEEGFESANVPDLGTDTWNLGTVNLGSDGVWGVFDNGVGINQNWSINSGVATPPLVYEGANAAYMNRENIGVGNISQDYLATPLITIPANGQLRFFTRTTINGDQGTKYKIMVAESPDAAPVPQNVPANYVQVQQWTETTLTSTFNIYEEKLVDLSAYAGKKVYVAFMMEFTQPTAALGGDRWLVDKVRIGERCLDPTALNASFITQSSATLTWANPSGATQWELEIIPVAASPTGANLITVNTTPSYVATATTTPAAAFAPSTQYKYYVRAVCGNQFVSGWSGPYPFTTVSPGISCDAPIVIPPGVPYSTTDSTANYGDLTDDPQPAACAGTATNYMTGNDVFYSYTPTADAAISITMTPTGNWSGIFVYDGCANVGISCVAGVANSGNGVREIPSLSVTAGHNYIIVISTNASPQSVDYTLVIQTLNCAPPTSLSATGTGPTTANLNWANPSGASSWEVVIQTAGSTIPSGSGDVANTNVNYPATALTGSGTPLALGTNYQYWVRAACGDGTFSPWAGPYLFNTSNCSSGCNYSFVMTDQFGGWEGNTMTIMQGSLTIATIGDTFTSGTGPVTVSVPLCAGPFDLIWNNTGNFGNEVGISIVNSFGQTIFTHESGNDLSGTTLYSGIVDCSNPVCLPPTNLSVAAETTSGATLSWIPNGPVPASWDIYAVPLGDPAPTSASVPTANTTNNPYTITGLLPDTTYVYYVRAVCSSPGENPWSQVSPEFTTLPTCPKPTSLTVSNIDLNQATIAWTAGGSETAWQIIVLAAGSTPPNAASTGWVAATNPFTLTGLTSGTSYDVYVRGVCSGTDISTWAGPLNFNTSICPAAQQCLYSFTMTDSFGDGWNGNTIAIIQNGVTVATLTGPPTNGPQTVQVPLCNGIPFEVFWTTDGFFATEVGLSATSFLGDVLFTHAPGTNLQGTTLYSGTGECVPPTCLKPTNVVVSNIGLDSATVTWTENNTPAVSSWDIIVLPATAPAPLADATGWTNVSTNPYTVTGLTSATSYKVYVRAVCSGTDSSFWSLGTQFSTVICPPSNLCDYTFVMVDSYGDGWNGNTMTVTQNGIAVATLTGPTGLDGQNPVYQTVSLCNNVPFELFWNSGGFFATEVGVSIVNASDTTVFEHVPGNDAQNSQLFAGTVSCVPPTCPKPVQLSVTNVGETSATLNWTEAASATTWEVIMLPAGSPPPTASSTGIITTNNPYQATNLTSGTSYIFYVRAVCSSTDSSNWAGPKPFATLITNDECATATVVLQNPDQSCTSTATGTLVGATPSNVASTCGGTADDDVWFQFVATSTSVSIDLTNISGSTSDLYHALWSGACGTLTNLYCSDNNQSIAANLVVGQTYYIQVYSWTSDPSQTSTFNVCVGTIPPAITVTQNEFTPEQLIENILLNSSCAGVSNITYSTGTNFGDPFNGVGYFEKNGSSFPFDYGLVLTTGQASSAVGPNTSLLGDGTSVWPGDADLAGLLAAQGISGTLGNATKMEFDFVPVTNSISFNFVFASEEYGTFQCNYSDVFAFLLTDIVSGVTTNLAVVPSTTVPISVTTIHDTQYNTSCGSANEQYFGHYYLPPGESELAAPINFNGCTVPLTAFSSVIPGHQYHIKLAIADFGPFGQDNVYDSAVFLEGGSFGIGNIDLGQNLLQSTGNAVCAGGSTVLHTELDPALYNFQWSDLNGPIPGANTSSLNVTQAGTYTLTVNFTGTTCTGSDDIIVEYYAPVAPATPNDLYVCSSLPNAIFDLTQNNSVLLAPLGTGYTASYYLTFADASNEVNAISNPNAYTNVTNPQTIYVRVENNTSGCFAILDFDLIIQDLTPQFTLTSDFTFCSGVTPSPVLSITPQNFNLSDATYSWTLNTAPLPDTTSSITITQGGLYEITVYRGGCSATASVNVTMTASPTADILNDVTVCDSYILPALSAGNHYFTQSGGGGVELLAGSSVTTSQTIYIYTGSGACTDQSSFVVTVNQTPDVQPVAAVSQCDSYALGVPAVGHYYSAADGAGTLLDNTTLTTSQTVWVYASVGTAPGNCFDQESFQVTITPSPVVVDMDDVSPCQSYTLPAIGVGGYFTAPDGGGTPLAPGQVITTSQTVYIYASNGACSDQDSFAVNIVSPPAFTIDSGCQGANYVLSVVPATGSFDPAQAGYVWSVAGGGAIQGDSSGQSVVISGAGDYSVVVSIGDCDHTESVSVDSTGCTIQKGISPNGDGLNDYFDLEGQNVSKLEIFNRYGTIVYKQSNYTTQWHGQTDGGDELPDGTYYYVIERSAGETKTGWIYINRERN